jgi:hypothetical protein
MRHLIGVLGLSTFVACGGGGSSPTVASTPPAAVATPSGWTAGTKVELVDGESGRPVEGTVIVAGNPTPAGSSLATAAAVGATVDVTVTGFLARQTLVRTGESRLVLWPDSASMPADYTRSLVYTAGTDDQGAPALASLRRLPTRIRTVAITLSSDLQGDADAVVAHRATVDGINAATAPLGVVYQLGGSADFSIPAKVDPTDSTCANDRLVRAFASVWLSTSSEITRAEITYCGYSVAETTGTISHEVGHTLGFRHSLDPHDMMYPYDVSAAAITPTEREALTFALMRSRRPGTDWPDNDRTTTAAAGAHVERIVN